MIYILDRSEKIVGFLQNRIDKMVKNIYFEDLLTEDLATGSETYAISSLCEDNTAKYLEVGNYIAFKKNNYYKLLQIVETDEEKEEVLVKKIYCETAGMELLGNVYRGGTLNNVNIRRFLENVLQDTHWKVGKVDENLTTTLALELEEKEVYSLIQENISKFNAEIEFRVDIKGNKIVGRYIDVYSARGKYTGKRLEITKDINKISRKIDIFSYATKLIGVGKDGLSFKDIQAADKPLGQNFIVNQKAYERLNNKGSHITRIFEYDTTDANELLLQTRKALEQMSQPQVTYEIDCNIVDIDVEVGDTLIVSDMSFNPPLTIATRVGKLETSRADKTLNKATLTNFKEIKSGITKYSIGTNDVLDGAITQDKIDDMYTQTITTDILEATKIYADELFVDTAKIKDLEAINATIENLTAKDAQIENVVVENLQATNAKIENLKADYAEIDQLIANKAEIKDLEVINANINALRADKADITQLNAINANINHLQADIAEIDTLLAGNITSENIAAGTITAGSGIIAEGAIGDAQISNINANKINAGEIDTSKVKVKGSNGYLFIENNTLYVVDNKKQIRCELGVIENNTNYGFIVRGSDGKTVLIDHNGVHNAGITDGAIDNRKVSENANISGKKLDIDSVIRTINEDGSVTIEGTKIQIGNTTLDIELSKQTNLINEHSTQLNTQQASIKANTEAIKLKVDSQTYTQDKSNMTSKIDKATSSINILEGKVNLKAEKTEITNAINNISVGTRNFVQNGDFKKTIKMGGITNKHHDLYADLWSGYNAGIPNPTTSYHAHIDNDTFGFNVIEFNESEGTRNWKAIHQSIRSVFQLGGSYRLSIDVYVTGAGTKLYGGFYYNKIGNSAQAFHSGMFNFDTSKFMINEWQRVSIEVPYPLDIDTTKDIRLYIYGYDFTSNCIMYIRNLSLNKSSQTTDWEPALEELETQITDKVNQGLNNITIGSRNILKNSKVNLVNSTNYKLAELYFGDEKPIHGQTYTISLKGQLASTKTAFGIYNSGGSVRLTNLTKNTLNNGIYTSTFNWIGTHPTVSISNTYIQIYQIESNETGASSIEWIKLEKGNKATDWSPAPEDIQEKLDENTREITKTKSQVANIGLEIDSITSKVSTVEDTITRVNEEVVKHEARIQSAESKITDNAIANVVKQSQFIKDIEGNIKEVESAVSSVEQTANSITSTVSDLNGKYTEIKQTIDGIDLTGKVSFSDLSTSGKTTIHGANLSTGTVTADKIAAGAITANMITAGTLNASKVNVTNLNASNITTGTLSGDRIKGGTLSATNEINFVGGARIFGNTGAYDAGLTISAQQYNFNSGEAYFEDNLYARKNLTVTSNIKGASATITGTASIGNVNTNGLNVYGSTSLSGALYTSGAATIGSSLSVKNSAIYGMNNLALSRSSLYIPNFSGSVTMDYLRVGAGFVGCTDGGVFHIITNNASRNLQLGSGQSLYLPHSNGYVTAEMVRLGAGIIATPSSGSFHFITASGATTPLYAGTLYSRSVLSVDEPEIINEESVFDKINSINVISTSKGLRLHNPASSIDALEDSMEVIKTSYDKEKGEINTDIDYTSAIATLWKAVQELKKENQELKNIYTGEN